MTEVDVRVVELEAEVARLRAELAAREKSASGPGEDPGVARILGDRSLLGSLPDMITVLDREHRFLYVNRTIPGVRVEDLIGRCSLDYVVAEERATRREMLERAWTTGSVQTIDSRTQSGYVWDNRFVPIVEDGRVAYLLTTAVDVTERRRAEDALRDSASMLRHAIDATGMGTWVRDRNGVRWDDALCRILGVEPSDEPRSADAFVDTIHPDDRDRCIAMVADARTTGLYGHMECRVVRPTGEVRYVIVKASVALDANGAVARSFGGVFDVTDHEALEAQLRHAQKMDAIGQLTAGIAHNFNNILAVILPTAEICRRDAPASLASRLEAIVRAGERGADMIRHLMLFARRDATARRETISSAECVRGTIAMCRTTFDAGITIELTVAPDAPAIVANAGEIEQVLLNVCLNARDALVESRREGPCIRIAVDRSPSGFARIRISDNGPGMDDATRSRIFEPFFTTKDVARGTGLGLATAYAIVVDHGGRILCDSSVGEGTTFTIELPEAGATAPSEATPISKPVAGGSETILVVDDEPLVRTATREVLELGGYRVLEAADGAGALGLFERERSAVGAVILDRSMPGISGETVLEGLLAIDPALPVLVLSGHLGPDAGWERAAARITKPVRTDVLLTTVREVLDEARMRDAS